MSLSPPAQDPTLLPSPVRQKTSKKTSRRYGDDDDDSCHSRDRSPRHGHYRSGRKASAKRRRHSRSPRPRPTRCQACGGSPLPDKLICRDCLRDYAADRESESLQVADLLKKAVKDSLTELVATRPTQQPASPPQELMAEASIPGPSTSGSGRLFPPSSSKHQDEMAVSEDSSDDTDASGFAFAMVQPYVQAVKQAIGWEDSNVEVRKSKSYFPFLKRQISFFPLMEEIRENLEIFDKVTESLGIQQTSM
ncbi:uncharacterized protein LOC143981487 [Lithobates pipiens]